MTRVPCWGYAGWAFYYRDINKIQWFPGNVPDKKLEKRLNWLLRCAAASNFYLIQFDDWHSNRFKYFIEILAVREFYESAGSLLWEQHDIEPHICYYLGSYPLLWWDDPGTIGGYITGRPGATTPIGYEVIDEYMKELALDRMKRLEWEQTFKKKFEDSLTKKQLVMLRRWSVMYRCLHEKKLTIIPGDIARPLPITTKRIFPGLSTPNLTLPDPDRPPSQKPKPPSKLFRLNFSMGFTPPGRPDGLIIDTDLEQVR